MQKGDHISHYTIESPIGSGGMGDVWLALDARLQRKVAIKIIQQGAEESDSAARLLREARTAAALTHPNVVSVFDVGEHEGRVFLAMEYVVGKTLREYVGKADPPWSRRVRWLVDVARALSAAHRKGLVHRDIKPENVMVRDEDGLVKVLDFGIARRAVSEVDPTGRTEVASFGTLTGKGQIIGTPMYMAPEQIKGNMCDARSDQFAWGVLAFELLAGRRPWKDKNDLLAAVAHILTESPAPLTELAPDVPEVVCDVIHRAIAREPDARFESMEDVAELIETHAAGSSPRRSGTPAQTTKKSVAVPDNVEVKRPPARISDAGERASTKNAMVTERSLGAEPPPPEPPRRGIKRSIFALGLLCGLSLSGYAAWRWTHPKIVHPQTPSAVVDAGALPKPPTENAEALRTYNEGMQLFKDGAWAKARTSFEASEKADPAFPAPSLMLALLLEASDEIGREPYLRAMPNRARLSPADLALFDAMDPAVMTRDWENAEKRASARAEKVSGDVYAHFWLGIVRQQRSDYENAIKAFDRALNADPSFIPARRAKAIALGDSGQSDKALKELDECVKRSAAAAICLRTRLRLLDQEGQCTRMEQDARAWSAIEPMAYEPDYHLAVALAAQKSPRDGIQEALKRQWTKLPSDRKDANEASDQADLAVLEGNFTAAEQAARTWQNTLGPDADVLERAQPVRLLVHLSYEAGDVSKAADLADSFEKRMKGYPQRGNVDPSLGFDEFLFRANRLTKVELDDHRSSWLTRAESKETQREKQRHIGERWAFIYAGFAETLEEATEALSKFDQFQPMPPASRQSIEFAAAVGKTYALAGKSDDALPYLERVTRSCSALRNPSIHTRSFYFLGLAKEQKGDLEGARAAYREVVTRWGNAKPKSTTSDKAKLRLGSIGP